MDNLFRKSTVYAYHVRELDAIKVGFGENPNSRMINYCKTHNLSCHQSSLRSWKIPAPSVASALETAIHKGLEGAGFDRLDYTSQNGRAIELFALGGRNFNDAILYVAELLDVLTGKLISQLGSGRVEIERRKQSELRVIQRKEQFILKKRDREQARVAEFIAEWEDGFNEYIKPWSELLEESMSIRKNYKKPGIFYKIKHGEDIIPHYIEWNGYTKLLIILHPYFVECRKARKFRKYILDKYKQCIRDKSNVYGFNLTRPCAKKGWSYRNQGMTPNLWDLSYYVEGDFISKNEDFLCIFDDKRWANNDLRWINIELSLTLNDVFGLGQETSFELVRRGMPEMLSLLTLRAKKELPPEFSG